MRLAVVGNIKHPAIAELVPQWLDWLMGRTEVVVAEDLARVLNVRAPRYNIAPRKRVHANCD
ncbi:MAG: hypothetical protein AAB354_04660, partial [candidate division KSB1 bacterium]